MRLTIEGMGANLIDRQLLRFEQSLEVPVVALSEVAVVLREAIERQFDTEGGNSGGWAPLAESTLLERGRSAARGEPTRGRAVTSYIGGIQDAKILQVTMRLKDSLTRLFDEDHIEEPLSPTVLRFGTRVPYAIYHQTGTSRMPKRPPVALSAADRVAMVKVIQRALIAGGAHPFARGPR